MNDVKDLTLILRSRFPIVVVETPEENRVMELLEQVANLESQALFVWNAADCMRRKNRPQTGSPNAWGRTQTEKGKDGYYTAGAMPETCEFGAALKHIYATMQNGIYVLQDAHPYLNDPIHQRLIKNTAQEYEKSPRTLVFISRKVDLPPDLLRLAARFDLDLPDVATLRKMIADELAEHGNAGAAAVGLGEAGEAIVQHLVGMCAEDVRRVVRQCIKDDGRLTVDDVAKVLKAKQEALGASSVVQVELETTQLSDVAGLQHLKKWLTQRRAPFLGDAASMGLDTPKGVLLLGVQGGGKSLAAKSVAGTWHVPLLRLDFSTLYNKWLGETERNLREALKFADAMAPCVLWMDEIEKGIATGASDGGESRRLLGAVLTWMAERKSKVFMVATANDIEQLPPELVRKGRFDEIFFVDLPGIEARTEIFWIHMKRRKLDPTAFDIAQLTIATDGYSGAEIEQAIVSALYEAHALQRPVATEHILAEVKRTRPLSVVMAEKIAALRAWAADRTVPAG